MLRVAIQKWLDTVILAAGTVRIATDPHLAVGSRHDSGWGSYPNYLTTEPSGDRKMRNEQSEPFISSIIMYIRYIYLYEKLKNMSENCSDKPSMRKLDGLLFEEPLNFVV